jgi:hypothetical protein
VSGPELRHPSPPPEHPIRHSGAGASGGRKDADTNQDGVLDKTDAGEDAATAEFADGDVNKDGKISVELGRLSQSSANPKSGMKISVQKMMPALPGAKLCAVTIKAINLLCDLVRVVGKVDDTVRERTCG